MVIHKSMKNNGPCIRLFLEKACYVSAVGKEDPTNEEQQREYSLPDGEKIMIGSAKYKAPEILFNPERKFLLQY